MPQRIAAGLLAAAVVATAAPLAAQEDADLTEVSRRAATFLRKLENDPKTAFEDLLANSKLLENDEIDRLTDAAAKHPAKYGAFVAAERVDARRIGQDLVLLTYVYKAERFPVIWRFAFYRPRELDDWAVVSLRFDSKLLDLIRKPLQP